MKKLILMISATTLFISCGPSQQELNAAEAASRNPNTVTSGNGSYNIYKEKIDSSEYIIVTNGYSCAIIKHK